MTNDKVSNDTLRCETDDDLDSAAVPTRIDTDTVICGKSKGVCSQNDANNKSDQNFTKDQTVFYKSAQGIAEEALILEVHVDDLLVPYYTIRLLGSGREKQTDGARISTLSDLCKSSETNDVVNNMQSPTTPSGPLRSILRPSSYGRNNKITPVMTVRKGDDRCKMLTSSKKFLQSIEKRLSERKAREKRAAQVVTPDSASHRLNMTPKQLVYTGTRKRMRAVDDYDEIESTRVRKKRRLAIVEEESITTADDPLPFHFMPRSSKLSSSTLDITQDTRNYPEVVPTVLLDWPVNGGGYYPISFHDRHCNRDQSRSIEYHMLLFEEILTDLENHAAEESIRIDAGTSAPSLLSLVVTSLSFFSARYVSCTWEFIKSKFSFGSASVKQTLEVDPSGLPVGVDDTRSNPAATDDSTLSSSTSVLLPNVTRREMSLTTPTQKPIHSPQNVSIKRLLPRPPNRLQNAFAIKNGHWKCKTCFYQNPSEAMTCDVCTALRDDRRVSGDSHSINTQSSNAHSSNAHSSDAQSDGPNSEASSSGDSYTDDDTYTSSDTATDDDTLTITTNGTEFDDYQTSCTSTKPAEAHPKSTNATKEEDSNAASPSKNVTVDTEVRRRSSLARAMERIRADRAINAAFHARFHARAQSPSSYDEASQTIKSKRIRRVSDAELVGGSISADAETTVAGAVTEELDVVDLDLAPFLEASLDTDVETMSVTSGMSFVSRVDKSDTMELDGALHNKRVCNDYSAYGKKQRL